MDSLIRPLESDCCNSGCNPCILDVYEEQLQKYKNQARSPADNSKNCMSQTSYTAFKLVKIEEHTWDTFLFTFRFAGDGEERLAVSYCPGQYFMLKGHLYDDPNDHFTRAYTPIPTEDDDPLAFTVLIKLYEEGSMSRFIKRLQIHSLSFWRGPYGSFEMDYGHRYMLLIAQGTGIAPLYAVIVDILRNEECDSFLKLFFCCRMEDDILLRDKLYECSSYWNFTYEVFLSKSNRIKHRYNEVVHSNRLDFKSINAYLGDKTGCDVKVLICGSENFNQSMFDAVAKCGVESGKIYLF